MPSYSWAKLWIDTLDDHKVGTLSDHLWRRFFEFVLLAKELDQDGFLPPIAAMAWRLRSDPQAIEAALEALAEVTGGEPGPGLVQLVGGCWHVTNFAKRQEKPMDAAERKARQRARDNRPSRRGHKPVTPRDTEEEGEGEGEEEEETEGEQSALRAPSPGSPHPAISLYERVTDRSVPNDSWRQRIQETVGLDPPALQLWESVLDSWVGHGWNPANVDGLLDVFEKGGIDERGERGNGGGRREPMPTKESIKRSWGPYLVGGVQPDDASSALSAGKPP